MLRTGEFEKAVGVILNANGWYNGGWRRRADALAHSALPRPLSAGEAIDELIGVERLTSAQAEEAARESRHTVTIRIESE